MFLVSVLVSIKKGS